MKILVRGLTFTLIAVLCVSAIYSQQTGSKRRMAFKTMLGNTAVPITGNEGGILQSGAARFQNTFSNPKYNNAKYDAYFYSNDVGGILVQNHPQDPDAVLKLDFLTFKIDKSKVPAVVHFRLGANGEEAQFTVEASLVSAAARMAADDKLVVLTLAAGSGDPKFLTPKEMFAVHPAISRHRLTIAAAELDASILNVADLRATYYILSEAPWDLGVKAFDSKQNRYKLECRNGTQIVDRPNLTKEWVQQLDEKQKIALGQLDEFLAAYRLINAAAEGHLEDFPEADFLKLLKQTQPYFEAEAVTGEEEEKFNDWLDDLFSQQRRRIEQILKMK